MHKGANAWLSRLDFQWKFKANKCHNYPFPKQILDSSKPKEFADKLEFDENGRN